MFLTLLSVALLQAAAPASEPAAAPPAAATPAPAAAAPPPSSVADQFICRNEMVTGSRFPQKVCRRKTEFAQKAAEDQQRIRQMQRPQYSCQISGGC